MQTSSIYVMVFCFFLVWFGYSSVVNESFNIQTYVRYSLTLRQKAIHIGMATHRVLLLPNT
jgi:cytochrome c oxidase subunit IV